MRKVVKSHEIAHLWAHQTQSDARCSSSMSFDGRAFFSYGTVIASIVDAPNSERVYLVSDRHYSVTTSAHQSHVRRAIPHGATVFYVPGTSRGASWYTFAESSRIMREWSEQVNSLIDDASASRQPKKNRLLVEASQVVEKMRRYAEFFQLTKVEFPTIPASADELARVIAEREENQRRAQERRIAKEKRERAKRKRETMSEREQWLAGDNVSLYGFAPYHETLLRVIGDEVETSRGVSFPVSHARRGLALVESVIKSKREWVRNGHTCHLGHYQIDRIEPNGTVHAGCHVVPFSSIARVMPELLASKVGE